MMINNKIKDFEKYETEIKDSKSNDKNTFSSFLLIIVLILYILLIYYILFKYQSLKELPNECLEVNEIAKTKNLDLLIIYQPMVNCSNNTLTDTILNNSHQTHFYNFSSKYQTDFLRCSNEKISIGSKLNLIVENKQLPINNQTSGTTSVQTSQEDLTSALPKSNEVSAGNENEKISLSFNQSFVSFRQSSNLRNKKTLEKLKSLQFNANFESDQISAKFPEIRFNRIGLVKPKLRRLQRTSTVHSMAKIDLSTNLNFAQNSNKLIGTGLNSNSLVKPKPKRLQRSSSLNSKQNLVKNLRIKPNRNVLFKRKLKQFSTFHNRSKFDLSLCSSPKHSTVFTTQTSRKPQILDNVFKNEQFPSSDQKFDFITPQSHSQNNTNSDFSILQTDHSQASLSSFKFPKNLITFNNISSYPNDISNNLKFVDFKLPVNTPNHKFVMSSKVPNTLFSNILQSREPEELYFDTKTFLVLKNPQLSNNFIPKSNSDGMQPGFKIPNIPRKNMSNLAVLHKSLKLFKFVPK